MPPSRELLSELLGAYSGRSSAAADLSAEAGLAASAAASTAAVAKKDAEGGLFRQLKDVFGDALGGTVAAGPQAIGLSGRAGLRGLAEGTELLTSRKTSNAPKNAREALGLDPESGGRPAGAFDTVLTTLFDPATYVTLGGGKAAAAAGKATGIKFAGKTIPGTVKAAQAIKGTTAPAVKAARTAPGIKHLREAFIVGRGTLDAGGAGARSALLSAKADAQATERLIRSGNLATLADLGTFDEISQRRIMNALEGGPAVGALNAEEEAAFNVLRGIQLDSDELLRQAKIPEYMLRDPETFVKHLLTDEAKDALETEAYTGTTRNIFKRSRDKTALRINREREERGLAALFSEDPVQAVRVQADTAARLAADRQVLEAAANNPKFVDFEGAPLIRVGPSAPAKTGWDLVSHPQAEIKMWAPTDMAANLKRVRMWRPDTQIGREILSSIDSLTGFMKGATLLNPIKAPSFISRNLMTGVVSVAAENPKYLAQTANATKVMKAFSKLDRKVLSTGNYDVMAEAWKAAGLEDDLIEPAVEALRTGALIPDESEVQEFLAGKSKTILGKVATPQVFRKANATAENSTRVLAFLGAKAEGLSSSQAAQVVRDTLFDYTREGATAFENNVMKRLTFYTWARNIVPLVARQTARRPGVAATLQRAGLGFPDPEADYAETPSWALGLRNIDLPLIGRVAAGFDSPATSAIDTLGSVVRPGGAFGEPLPEAFFGPVPGAAGVLLGGGRKDRGLGENLVRETFTPVDLLLRLKEDLQDDRKRPTAILRYLTGLRASPLETDEQQLARLKAEAREIARKEPAKGPKKPPRPLSRAEIKRLLED